MSELHGKPYLSTMLQRREGPSVNTSSRQTRRGRVKPSIIAPPIFIAKNSKASPSKSLLAWTYKAPHHPEVV
ncbi:hypothetical protein BV898_04795 [Hypsibius exemplaris]|uniref:Uncharacterized protein n=1 Tax=Hypsibius exemplaris TaxID=2072580 RepID=A0A1W0X1M6_HYPEX|nr:hypothetical protein BV898_04795 [Hypsibius exemplaris]